MAAVEGFSTRLPLGTPSLTHVRPVRMLAHRHVHHQYKDCRRSAVLLCEAALNTADASASGDETSWRDRLPDRNYIAATVITIALVTYWRPMLVAQIAYAAGGVGVGYGGTKIMRFLSSTEAREKIFSFVKSNLNVRRKLREALLKFDPSLADDEGSTLGFRDLRMKRGKKKKRWGPAPPWQKKDD